MLYARKVLSALALFLCAFTHTVHAAFLRRVARPVTNAWSAGALATRPAIHLAPRTVAAHLSTGAGRTTDEQLQSTIDVLKSKLKSQSTIEGLASKVHWRSPEQEKPAEEYKKKVEKAQEFFAYGKKHFTPSMSKAVTPGSREQIQAQIDEDEKLRIKSIAAIFIEGEGWMSSDEAEDEDWNSATQIMTQEAKQYGNMMKHGRRLLKEAEDLSIESGLSSQGDHLAPASRSVRSPLRSDTTPLGARSMSTYRPDERKTPCRRKARLIVAEIERLTVAEISKSSWYPKGTNPQLRQPEEPLPTRFHGDFRHPSHEEPASEGLVTSVTAFRVPAGNVQRNPDHEDV